MIFMLVRVMSPTFVNSLIKRNETSILSIIYKCLKLLKWLRLIKEISKPGASLGELNYRHEIEETAYKYYEIKKFSLNSKFRTSRIAPHCA